MNELLKLREYITGCIKVLHISLVGTKIKGNIIEQQTIIGQIMSYENIIKYVDEIIGN